MPDRDANGKPIPSKGAETGKKDAFALAYIQTRSWREAYHRAYTPEAMSYESVRAAYTKLRKDPFVQRRVEEYDADLQEQTRLSLANIVQQLQEDRLLAHKEGQAAAAVQADMHIAKILGFYWDRRQVVVSNDFDAMTTQELRDYVTRQTQALGITETAGRLMIEHNADEFEEGEEGEGEEKGG